MQILKRVLCTCFNVLFVAILVTPLYFCTATAFGKGVYFACHFAYSAQHIYSPPDYEFKKNVFQCRVLTGHYQVGKPDLIEPPVKCKKTQSLYDSVVDNKRYPAVFVIFHDIQVYPEYLIKFRAP